MLTPIIREDAPCSGCFLPGATEALPSDTIPETKTTTWVDPVYTCEVRYREWTPDGLLRHPAFLRMRPDKPPRDCERQFTTGNTEATEESVASVISEANDSSVASVVSVVEVPLTNLKKVYWPGDGYTKGDLIEYYRAISPWLLP